MKGKTEKVEDVLGLGSDDAGQGRGDNLRGMAASALEMSAGKPVHVGD